MSETEEPKPDQTSEDQFENEEEMEEGGWPSWLSWGLVVIAAVFGGFLLGHQGAGRSTELDKTKQYADARQIALMKAEQKRALNRAEQAVQQYMQSFTREMIRLGLFRDGLGERLGKVQEELEKITAQLGKADADPKQAAQKLKTLQKSLEETVKIYDRQAAAMEKVGRIGNVDEALKSMNRKFAYLFFIRVQELLPKVQAGDKAATVEVKRLMAQIRRDDPELAQKLEQQSPQLAPQQPTTQNVDKAPTPPATP